MNNHDKRDINRRSFLKIFGGGAAITAAAMSGLDVNALPKEEVMRRPTIQKEK